MRVAALYDIHGNLPALEAVLEEIEEIGVDRIVVGGDVVPGPMPRESIIRLLELEVPVDFVHGNGESDIIGIHGGEMPARVPEPFHPTMQWVSNELASEQITELTQWPRTLRTEIPGLGRVLFCHATPRSDNEIFTRVTPEPHLRPLFEPQDVAVVVCGHTHMPFDRMVGRVRVVNPGSLGMPFGRSGAFWMLLGPDIEHRRTTYDLEAAAERIRATGYPQAETFVERSLIEPPAEDEMIELFEGSALRVRSKPMS